MIDKKISIIGLGLIGGALAKAFKERLDIREIIAINRTNMPLELALSDGTITKGFNDINEYIYDSDVIFICTPVKKTLTYIKELSGKVKSNCIITDVGSTKYEIVSYINNMVNPPCFVGGHPMAGTENSGYANSFSHMFENAYYILTPSKTTTDNSLDILFELIKATGALPIVLDASDHDRITGSISHVPHIVASSLVTLISTSETNDNKMQTFAAGGFKDITRIASSSPEMWENIVLSNHQQIKGILRKYVEIVQKFISYIDGKDSKNILNFFTSAKIYRDSLSSSKVSSPYSSYEIIVDVIDKPGIIGEIATLLGGKGINIKNINVSNNREMENGCLVITLANAENMKYSAELLSKNNYKVYYTD